MTINISLPTMSEFSGDSARNPVFTLLGRAFTSKSSGKGGLSKIRLGRESSREFLLGLGFVGAFDLAPLLFPFRRGGREDFPDPETEEGGRIMQPPS
ncbi:MAG: hypothetical protein ACKO29_01710 [Actinomycetota bacterium]